jgi:pimeloyl-ACP methyl ester carboxylesterase
MGVRLAGAAIVVIALLLAGCASPVISPKANNIVLVVPGIGGDDSNYRGVCTALSESGNHDRLQVFDWGPGWALCFVSLSSSDLHHHTEARLADFVAQWRAQHPQARITLIGHSAGAGVILGMLPRLSDNTGEIGPIILLAPALSPDYDLKPALQHANIIHVFFSEHDDLWQGIGPVLFGGYDSVHRNGAGRRGFTLTNLTPEEKQKVIQHPFDPNWEPLGEHGGHFDWMKPDFVRKVLQPLIDLQTDRSPSS